MSRSEAKTPLNGNETSDNVSQSKISPVPLAMLSERSSLESSFQDSTAREQLKAHETFNSSRKTESPRKNTVLEEENKISDRDDLIKPIEIKQTTIEDKH